MFLFILLDHDECKGNRHGCEQQCLNLPGGYTCTCSVGYSLNAKDLKTCDGIYFTNEILILLLISHLYLIPLIRFNNRI